MAVASIDVKFHVLDVLCSWQACNVPQASMVAWAQIMVRGSLAAVPSEDAMHAANTAMRDFEAELQRALPSLAGFSAEQSIFESRFKGLSPAAGEASFM